MEEEITFKLTPEGRKLFVETDPNHFFGISTTPGGGYTYSPKEIEKICSASMNILREGILRISLDGGHAEMTGLGDTALIYNDIHTNGTSLYNKSGTVGYYLLGLQALESIGLACPVEQNYAHYFVTSGFEKDRRAYDEFSMMIDSIVSPGHSIKLSSERAKAFSECKLIELSLKTYGLMEIE